MTATHDLIREHREAILEIARRHGARNVRVFGSVARDTAHPDSDIDFLVDLEPRRTLLDLAHLQQDLEGLLGVNVDVGTASSLRERIRDRVLREAVAV